MKASSPSNSTYAGKNYHTEIALSSKKMNEASFMLSTYPNDRTSALSESRAA